MLRRRLDETTHLIDRIATHKLWGLPIFFLIIYLLFSATFQLGDYPMRWIDAGVDAIDGWVNTAIAPGVFRDMLSQGIIRGVGGVIVFLPNILILYLGLSLMEQCGYMERATLLMDNLMHRMGLHGSSFIPLVMGFGCNVPAILSTRTIEHRDSRLITLLVLPLMSCSARLPVYILLAGTFFPQQAVWVMLGVYGTGVVLAIIVARLLRLLLFADNNEHHIVILHPYRRPSLRQLFRQTWLLTRQYLQKMAGIILVASIVIWALGYYPIGEASYIERIGRWITPWLAPLGFDEPISIALLSGIAAKEVIVSTMGILHATEGLSPLTALSVMIFVLLYVPCIATLTAIRKESGSWRWMCFALFYTTLLAWLLSWIVFQVGTLWGY